jgi:hypothetical protein
MKTQSLESRIARIAEDYGDPLLSRAAIEVGEVVAERDRLRSPWRKAGWVLWGAFCASVGSVIGHVALRMGWL